MDGQNVTEILSTSLSSNIENTPAHVKEAIAVIDGVAHEHRSWPDANGLPLDIFYLSTRLSPTLNVDLLIKDETGRTLLAWRDDRTAGHGWHIPGGIVRFKETLIERVHKVAAEELGTNVKVDPIPISHNEVIRSHHTRGHFYSVLFSCTLDSSYAPANSGMTPGDVGYLRWHTTAPDNLVQVHEMYREHI
jgi:ADP-ribose pyrophosphatase YjhB (NUDIX family)